MGKSCRLLLALVLLLLAVPALAAPCGGDFNAFLAATARDAQGQGVSRAVIDQAFAGLTPDPPSSPSTAASAACSTPRASRNTPPPGSSRPASVAPGN